MLYHVYGCITYSKAPSSGKSYCPKSSHKAQPGVSQEGLFLPGSLMHCSTERRRGNATTDYMDLLHADGSQACLLCQNSCETFHRARPPQPEHLCPVLLPRVVSRVKKYDNAVKKSLKDLEVLQYFMVGGKCWHRQADILILLMDTKRQEKLGGLWELEFLLPTSVSTEDRGQGVAVASYSLPAGFSEGKANSQGRKTSGTKVNQTCSKRQ